MKKTTTLLFIFFTVFCNAQNDETTTSIFEKIALEMKEFKLDTTAVPNDNLSKKNRKIKKFKRRI